MIAPPQAELPAWLQHRSHAGPSTACDLRPISSTLYLTTFLYAPSSVINAHFLTHYLRIGVLPAHMRIFLEAGQPSSAADMAGMRGTQAALKEAGVPDDAISFVPHGNYTDKLMLRLANEHIATLPSTAYMIRADADEHFTYPCDMVARLATHDLWCADMVDRFAADGKVRAVLPRVEIAQQFPAVCWVRQHLRGDTAIGGADMQTAKIALMRVAPQGKGKKRSFKSSHRLFDQYGKHGRCRGLGFFAHYSMTQDALNFTERKKGLAYSSNRFQKADYGRMTTFMRRHLPGTPYDARDHPWCLPPSNRTTMRAFHIHGWMEPADRGVAMAVAKATVDEAERQAKGLGKSATGGPAARNATAARPPPSASIAEATVPVAATADVTSVLSTLSRPLIEVDGCRHVFIDLGCNLGSNVAALYEFPHEPQGRRAKSSLNRAFERYFGTSAQQRQRDACAICVEPNLHHAERLRLMETEHRKAGWRTTFLPRAASDVDGRELNFFFDGSRRGRKHGEWGASVFSTKDNRGTDGVANASAPTLTLDVARLLQQRVLPRRLPASTGDAKRPAVIIKMDIEGSEFSVLSRLLALGLLCSIDYLGVEFHDEAKFLSLLTAAGAPRNFARVLQYVREHAGPQCHVELVNLGLRDNA